MATEVFVPALGESVSEATVAGWRVEPGGAVTVDQPLVELETDKVTLEVNAPASGVLASIVAETGATVNGGSIACRHRRGRRRGGTGTGSGGHPGSCLCFRSGPGGPARTGARSRARTLAGGTQAGGRA